MQKTFLIAIVLIFTLVSCKKNDFPLSTVENVDINRYLGTWYEVARFEHFFEKDCKNVTANYSLRDDGQIDVLNKCVKIDDEKLKEANGIAYATDDSFSKLKVSFFRPFYGDYQIIMLGEQYDYAVIGTPSREYFWILSRTKTISEELKSKIIEKMKQEKFDPKLIIWTIQE